MYLIIRWNRSHVDWGGLGGSEEAVVFLAEALVRKVYYEDKEDKVIV